MSKEYVTVQLYGLYCNLDVFFLVDTEKVDLQTARETILQSIGELLASEYLESKDEHYLSLRYLVEDNGLNYSDKTNKQLFEKWQSIIDSILASKGLPENSIKLVIPSEVISVNCDLYLSESIVTKGQIPDTINTDPVSANEIKIYDYALRYLNKRRIQNQSEGNDGN